jgi:uncharacterized integral membrane protein
MLARSASPRARCSSTRTSRSSYCRPRPRRAERTDVTKLAGRIGRSSRKRRKSSEPADERSGVAGISWKVILLAALAVYAVLLIVFNSKTVSVNFVVITEKTRVIWLVLLSVALGALIMWLLPRIRRQREN